MEELRIDVDAPRDDAVVITVGGFVDTNTAPALETSLLEHVGGGARVVVVDLGAVDYVSSAGWGVMIAVVNRLREQGADLRLAALRPEVEQVYRLLEFPSILHAYASADDALADRSAL